MYFKGMLGKVMGAFLTDLLRRNFKSLEKTASRDFHGFCLTHYR